MWCAILSYTSILWYILPLSVQLPDIASSRSTDIQWNIYTYHAKHHTIPLKQYTVTRGPKGHITCTWVQCATFSINWPGLPFLCINRPEKDKLWRGIWDLASCQVSFKSVQRFKSKSWKCLSKWRTGQPSCFFLIGPKISNLVEEVEILFCAKFLWIPFSGFRGEVKNVSTNQKPSCFSDLPEKHKLGRGC